jgi:hypothetical protein
MKEGARNSPRRAEVAEFGERKKRKIRRAILPLRLKDTKLWSTNFFNVAPWRLCVKKL